MRTTLEIDEDVLQAAKELAAAQEMPVGKVLSDLARKALCLVGTEEVRNGVPLLPPKPNAPVLTPDAVEWLLNEET